MLSSLGYSGEFFDTAAQQQYLRARFYDPASGRFNRLDPFAGNMQDPQSLHKYAYVHGDPIQGVDPSGRFFTISGLLSSIGIRARQFAQEYKNVSTVSTKFYKVLVSLIVVLNYTVAYENPKLVAANALATPYNLSLLKQFNRLKPHQIQRFIYKKINTIARVISQAAVRSAAIATLEASLGVRIPIKRNGQPDLTPFLHPGPFSTVFFPLTGSRKKDEATANAISGRLLGTPKDYTWHHHEVVGIMQLVRKDVHKPLFGGHKTHYGGVFFWELLNNKKYKK